jgi:hypothetical protein
VASFLNKHVPATAALQFHPVFGFFADFHSPAFLTFRAADQLGGQNPDQKQQQGNTDRSKDDVTHCFTGFVKNSIPKTAFVHHTFGQAAASSHQGFVLVDEFPGSVFHQTGKLNRRLTDGIIEKDR